MNKTAGPDAVCCGVLKTCADPITDILNMSLSHEVVPASRLPPLTLYPKRSFSLDDFRCVAPTLILIKHIEKLVNQHIKASVPTSQDPHQFAFIINRSTEDDICSNLHATFRHLKNITIYVKAQSVDIPSVGPVKLRD